MLDDNRFTLSQVAEAAGVQVGTLRSWLQRKHWRLDMAIGDNPSDIAGRAHLATFRRALQVGTAVELVRNDVEPSRAFRAALSFVDGFSEVLDGGPRQDNGLFDDGLTLLAVYPGHDHGVIMRVDLGATSGSSSLSNILFPKLPSGRQTSGTFVCLNWIYDRMASHLLGGRP
ncbi:hypothetical protein [Methylobacterium sp. CM6247]